MPRKSPPAPPPPPQPEARLLDLSTLYLHPKNVRTEPPPLEIEALAEGIDALGLIQNLSGYDDPARPGETGIVAGGRRLRALWHLAATGRWTAPVPVKVTADEAVADAWAGAENVRSDPHMADEVRTYRDLRTRGQSPAQIARHLGRSEKGVRQRLKFADLPEPVLDAWRQGALTQDQAMALTLAEGPTGAEVTAAVLADPRRWHAGTIRGRLTPDTIRSTDRRVAFVGLDAYLAAGGRVTPDLFLDATYLHDANLLDRLFAEKAEAATEGLREAGGWAWATFAPHDVWRATEGLRAIFPDTVALPEGDADRLAELLALGETKELTDDQLAELDALEARTKVWTDDHRTTGGIVTTVNHDGNLTIHGHYRRAEAVTTTATPGDDRVTRTEKPAAAPPESLRLDLAAIRTLALQDAALAQPDLLTDLLAWQLAHAHYAWSVPLALTANPPKNLPDKAEGLTAPDSLTSPPASTTTATAAAFAAFRALPQADRTRALATGLARCLKAESRGAGADLTALLAEACQPNVRALWTPTAAGYFARLPGPMLDALWADLVPNDLGPPAGFIALKKAAKAQKLEALFSDLSVREALGLSRAQNARIDTWLPPELTFAAPEAGEGDDDDIEIEVEAPGPLEGDYHLEDEEMTHA